MRSTHALAERAQRRCRRSATRNTTGAKKASAAVKARPARNGPPKRSQSLFENLADTGHVARQRRAVRIAPNPHADIHRAIVAQRRKAAVHFARDALRPGLRVLVLGPDALVPVARGRARSPANPTPSARRRPAPAPCRSARRRGTRRNCSGPAKVTNSSSNGMPSVFISTHGRSDQLE